MTIAAITHYEHKQTSPLWLILLSVGVIQLVAGWFSRAAVPVALILSACGVLFVVLAMCFAWLLVRDEGDCLALRYGPLAVFRRRIPFSRSQSAQPGRTSGRHGWGLHGNTWNLWGFGCVRLKIRDRTIKVGTDDVDGLSQFLAERLRQERARPTQRATRPAP